MRPQTAAYVVRGLTKRGFVSRVEADQYGRCSIRIRLTDGAWMMWLGDTARATDAVVIGPRGVVALTPHNLASGTWSPEDCVEALASLAEELAAVSPSSPRLVGP